MVEKGHEVHVAAPLCPDHEAVQSELQRLGVTVHDLRMNRSGTRPIADLLLLVRMVLLMRAIRPRMSLCYTIKPVIYGSLSAWATAVPQRYALITGLGFAFTNGGRGPITRLVGSLYKVALSKVHKVIFQNRDDERFFRENGVISRSTRTAVVCGSGVDLEEYRRAPLPAGRPRFLMIARLLGNKGVREYAAAAAQTRESCPNARFSLAGWIDQNPDAISRGELDALVNEGNIEFLGRLEDVRPAISNSTVYVLPSYREGTPRTVLEAMAMGRPIITTDAPGSRETVIDGENGFLVPVKSVDSLAKAMQKFVDDPDLATRMGERSREIAEEKYDVHKVNSVMLREMGLTQAAPQK